MALYSVKFGDYDTLEDWGLYLAKPAEVSPPEVQTHYIQVPGRNGSIDLTESLTGGVAYNDRELKFRFLSIRPRGEWAALHKTVMDALHGKTMKITLSDDPEYYYEGRVFVEEWDLKHKNRVEYLTISATVGPFKWEMERAVYTANYSEEELSSTVEVTPTVQSTEVTATSVTVNYGTETLPTHDWSKYINIYVKGTYSGATAAGSRSYSAYVYVYSGTGEGSVIYTTTTVLGSSTLKDLTFTRKIATATLAEDGVDLSSIYRFVVTGASDVTITATIYGAGMTVEAGTVTSNPVAAVTGSGLTLSVGGDEMELEEGANDISEMSLTSGENTLVFAGDTAGLDISVSFLRGWL